MLLNLSYLVTLIRKVSAQSSMTAYIYCCAASAMRTAYRSQLQSSEKRDELQFRQSLVCANCVQERSQGGPGVPVTPPFTSLF